MRPIAVERVDVLPDAVRALVRCDPARMRTSAVPGLAERAVALLPGLRGHVCRNDAGARITEELRDTETAHLLEHVAVEIATLAGSRGASGETSWDFKADGRGVFRVRLTYDDDLVALGALKLAARVVDALLAGPPGEGDARADDGALAAEIEREVARLRGLRARRG